jgi:hypothetical protein
MNTDEHRWSSKCEGVFEEFHILFEIAAVSNRMESYLCSSVFICVHLWFPSPLRQISKSASSFAAQMKSFSERPPMACVT